MFVSAIALVAPSLSEKVALIFLVQLLVALVLGDLRKLLLGVLPYVCRHIWHLLLVQKLASALGEIPATRSKFARHLTFGFFWFLLICVLPKRLMHIVSLQLCLVRVHLSWLSHIVLSMLIGRHSLIVVKLALSWRKFVTCLTKFTWSVNFSTTSWFTSSAAHAPLATAKASWLWPCVCRSSLLPRIVLRLYKVCLETRILSKSISIIHLLHFNLSYIIII